MANETERIIGDGPKSLHKQPVGLTGIGAGEEGLDAKPERLTLSRRNFLRVIFLIITGAAIAKSESPIINTAVKLAKGEVNPLELQARYLEGKHPSREEFLATEDYPVVEEALEMVWAERQEGNIASDSINPFGERVDELHVREKVDSLYMFAYGDLHQSGSDPSKSALYKGIYNALLRIGINQIESIRRYARLRFNKREKGKDIEKDDTGGQEEDKVKVQEKKSVAFDNWALNVRARRLTEGWLALRIILYHNLEMISEKFFQDEKKPGVKDKDNVLGVINVGDNGGPEGDVADISLTAEEIVDLGNQLRYRLRQLVGRLVRVVQVVLPGNHCEDLNNHPNSGDYLRKLYGQQAFLQYVGSKYVVLGLNTNLYDPFFLRFRESLEGDPELMEYIIYSKQQEEEQKRLIEQAKTSDREIIVFGHDLEGILSAINVTEAKVTYIIHGHTHTPGIKSLKQRNVDGKVIVEAIVGATLRRIPPWEKACYPVSYGIDIGPEGVDIRQLELPAGFEGMTPEDLEYLM